MMLYYVTVDRKPKDRRFESCARSIFRNAYFLQLLFWRLYVVAVLLTFKPNSTLNVEKQSVQEQKEPRLFRTWSFTFIIDRVSLFVPFWLGHILVGLFYLFPSLCPS